MNQLIEEKWKIELNNLRESFDDWSEDADGNEHYCPNIDWKMVVAFIENLLEQERKRMSEYIEKIFSVYADGGIHDFSQDEELISKNQVLSIINK